MMHAIRWPILLMGLLLAAACSPVQSPGATPAAVPSSANGDAASAPADVLAAVANDLGVQPADMTLVSAEAVEWNDACLGVVNADEMCAQVITPGYRVVVEVGGEQYTYHTDRTGASIRHAPNASGQIDKGSALNLDCLAVGSEGASGEVFGSAEQGFCLRVPEGYAMVETEPGNFSLVQGGDVMNHTAPRVSIEVSEAGERTPEQLTEQMVHDYVPAGEAIEPQPVTAGGVEGAMLDNLPGQDFNRRLWSVHNGRVYSLMFMPLSPEAEPFYQGVLDSLQFPGDQSATSGTADK